MQEARYLWALKVIQISNNKFKTLPRDMSKLFNLRHLNLRNYQIEAVPPKLVEIFFFKLLICATIICRHFLMSFAIQLV